MEYTGIPVEASVASARALASLVRKRYRLETPLVCTFRHKGLNDTYLLRSGESEYYLRLYRCGWRTKSEIEAEVDMLDYLARRRQPVSRPVKRYRLNKRISSNRVTRSSAESMLKIPA